MTVDIHEFNGFAREIALAVQSVRAKKSGPETLRQQRPALTILRKGLRRGS